MNDSIVVTVPLFDATLEPPPPARVRAFKKHLARSLRDLRSAKRPDRLVQKAAPEPAGLTAAVLSTGCATCRGHCCKGGGDHAYIDERTMARVRRDRPDLDARGVIGLYLARLPPLAYNGSCLFHGPNGCGLERALRAELCNAYYCDGLKEFLRLSDAPDQVRIVATRNGVERRSAAMSRNDQRS
jgi:hypothetical protein